MRVVSFVPSLTETLLESGVQVVGRTRFCIYPEFQVAAIPIVGGTKNINSIDEILSLKPDLVVFDKEENNLSMYQMCLDHGLNCYAMHVVNLKTCGEELLKLGDILNNPTLKHWGVGYLSLNKIPKRRFKECVMNGDINSLLEHNFFSYVIWKNPFMVVSANTFIGDVLALFDIHLKAYDKKYPEVDEEELKNMFCLFSSEPFPFEKYFAEMGHQGFKGLLVDGEKLSWYGVRTLKFLKSLELS